MKTYTPTIGLEIHAELKTETKMFCDSKNDPHHGEPNSHICPICMGHPGTLPVINKRAVEHVLTVGVALNANLASYTEFDRKNYFYPDIPKGYQISQYAYPLVTGGSLCDVAITRIHLEEDTARSLHDQGEGSIVDYNRAGVPLMELVTEPVIHDAKTAGDFARELQLLLRTLGASDANMEKGEMRVEANISVSDSDSFGTKVEVKNLNSFKSVEGAIAFEIKRQIEQLERGEKVIQETRGWDEVKGKTFAQRIKETANDYRYFPDPDLPKLDLRIGEELSLSRIQEKMPVLPAKKREKYENIGLAREQIEVIISNKFIDTFFSNAVSIDGIEPERIKLTANYLTTDLLPLLSSPAELANCSVSNFVSLMALVHSGKINSRIAKDLLRDVVIDGADPVALIAEKGLEQNNSEEAVMAIIDKVLAEHSAVADEVRTGKDSALQFLVGQCMRASRGSANPQLLASLLRKKILG
ncbi:MAG: Asp-tRNA(Asn)/Glu-tRNA(Gln) amidotransferase subunit GatB [Candidatus Kaiserbacteria bacterium]|nr:Asp-tRNA(Asn)/Glu-tRNA(Gln) amidotransferase subunit GatB [Candidatus Kaiserbacteria bacterium]